MFLELTSTDGRTLLINAFEVETIQHVGDIHTEVYMKSGRSILVTESVSDVLEEIKLATPGGY